MCVHILEHLLLSLSLNMMVKIEGVEKQPLSFIADFNGRGRGVRGVSGMQNESSIFGHGNSPATWTFLSSYNVFKN